MNMYNPETCHHNLMANLEGSLKFDPQKNFSEWKQSVAEKFRELIGDLPEKVSPNVRIEYERQTELFLEKRFVFTSEEYCEVPCHLLIPKSGRKPYPVVICIQGHSTGMHISLGRPKYEGDTELINGGRDFAIQAVNEGYAALVIEQRCFGERKDSNKPPAHMCHQGTVGALLLGRTMVGERTWDVSRAIDVLNGFDDLDTSRICCMGNSGGGTTTYYASCLDERIGVSMPSCSVCTYFDSIGTIYHCMDQYIPGILKYFEMADLACMIAPRPLIMVAGRQDPIFPIHGVEKAFDTIKQIYAAAGVPDKCRLLVGDLGHQFYPELAWPVMKQLSGG